MADALVGQPGRQGRFRQARETVVETHEQAAGIRCSPGRRRSCGGRRSGRRQGRRWQLGHAVVRLHLHAGHVRRVVDAGDAAVPRVQGEGHAKVRFQPGQVTGNIGEQQGVGLHQHRPAVRVRHRSRGRAGEQAVGEALGDEARLRRAGFGEELGVLGDQLDLVADLAQDHQVAAAHLAAVEAALADAFRNVVDKTERLVELIRRDGQPDFFVLLIDGEKPGSFPGFLDHVLERLGCRRSAAGRTPRRRCGGGCGGSAVGLGGLRLRRLGQQQEDAGKEGGDGPGFGSGHGRNPLGDERWDRKHKLSGAKCTVSGGGSAPRFRLRHAAKAQTP